MRWNVLIDELWRCSLVDFYSGFIVSRLDAPFEPYFVFLPLLAVSLLWSEDAGTGIQVWSTPPNLSRSDAASQVVEGWQGRTSSVRWTSSRRSSTPTSSRSMRSLKTRQRLSWSWSCELLCHLLFLCAHCKWRNWVLHLIFLHNGIGGGGDDSAFSNYYGLEGIQLKNDCTL